MKNIFSLTIKQTLAALIDQFLAVLNLGLEVLQLIVVIPVGDLQVLQLLDLQELFLTDDDVTVVVVGGT